MTTFQDKSSGLQFDFSENWSDLTQFDENPDVKKFAKGLSCIDFAGLFSKNKLVLIEAKNFKNRPASEHQSIFERLGSKEGSPLANEVAEKMKDFIVFVSHLSQTSTVSESEYWENLRGHLLEKEIMCVLWLETDNSKHEGAEGKQIFATKGILSDFLQKKLVWLADARNVFVASQTNQLTNPFGENLVVSVL